MKNKDWKFVNLNVSNYYQHYIHKQTLSLAYFDDITFKTIYLSYIHLKQCIRALLWVIKDFKQLLVSICMYSLINMQVDIIRINYMRFHYLFDWKRILLEIIKGVSP